MGLNTNDYHDNSFYHNQQAVDVAEVHVQGYQNNSFYQQAVDVAEVHVQGYQNNFFYHNQHDICLA
jgi:hypothetical protein